MVKHVEVLKLQIYPSFEQQLLFKQTQIAFTQACQFVSDSIFENDFELNQKTLRKWLYLRLREEFALPSALAQSVIKVVIAKYKTIRSQFSKQPFCFTDYYESVPKGQKKTVYRVFKTLEWLRKPVQFSKPFVEFMRNINYTIRSDGSISIGTLTGREIVTGQWNVDYFRNKFKEDWNFGSAILLERKDKWYLHISVSCDVDEPDKENISQIVGIDRGLRQIITTYDLNGKTNFVNGREIMHRRRKYKQLRAKLQAKGTKSAKKRLKQIGRRENRWMNDVNHCITKALVEQNPVNSLFVIEDLMGVRFATESLPKNIRYESVSWGFYDFEQKLMYKSELKGQQVIKVSAKYTSQRCPHCCSIRKENRDHKFHKYSCVACGYQSNDDRVAAMNLLELGKRYITGDMEPHFEKMRTKLEY